MDSTREPLPAFVDPSLIEAPFEVAVLGSSRAHTADVPRDFNDNDVMDALLDLSVEHDAPATSSSAQAQRAARAAAKVAAKVQAEAERRALAEAKSAAKLAKRDAKRVRRESLVDSSEFQADDASEAAVESELTPRVEDDAPEAKKSGLSFDELIGGSSS